MRRHLTSLAPVVVSLLLLTAGSWPHGPASVAGFRVVARDFALTIPPRTPAGLRQVRLVNAGKEPHYFGVMRVDSGKTVADFLAWRASRTARPAWLVTVGGAAPVEPGDSVEIALYLDPGHYIGFCSYPAGDGTSHLEKGMVGEFIVDSTFAPDEEPTETTELHLVNYAFTPSLHLGAGRQTLRVDNDSDELHQLLIIRLPDGVTPAQEIAWFRGGSRGPRPGRPNGGVLQLPPHEQVWMTMTFAPGRYLLLCPISDTMGRPHDQLGMFAVVDVKG